MTPSKSVAWVGLEKFGQAICQIAVLAVLGRLLSPEDFGLVAVALVVVNIVTILSEVGVGPAIVQREALGETDIRTAFTMAITLSLAFTALLWLLAPLIASALNANSLTPILRVISVTFVLRAASTVSESLLLRTMQYRALTLISLGAYIFGYALVGILLAAMGAGAWALVFAQLAQVAFSTTFLMLVQPHSRRLAVKWESLQGYFGFGSAYTVGRIFSTIAAEADKAIIGRYLGAEALGFYTRSFQLGAMPASLLGQILDRLLFPRMARLQQEPFAMRRAYYASTELVGLILLPLGIYMYLLSPELVAIILGRGWTESVLPMQVLSAGMLFRGGYRLADSLAKATGAVRGRAWRNLVFSLLMLFGAWFAKADGIVGISVAVTAALLTNYVLAAQQALRLTNMSWRTFMRAHLPGLVVGASLVVLATPGIVLLRNQSWTQITVLCFATFLAILVSALTFYCSRQLISNEVMTLARNTVRSIAVAVMRRVLRWPRT